MNIIFLAYRKWAIDVYPSIEKHPKVWHSVFCKTLGEIDSLDLNQFDLLITCGWSDEIGSIANEVTSIGVHCAELDRYSYGTPIQLQILDGIKRSKHRVFSFTEGLKSNRAHTHNRLYSHEVDLDLSGNMADILDNMTATSKMLFNWFLDDYPEIEWKTWPEEKVVRKKRKPEDSYIKKKDIENYTTEDLYNFFRCLEDPYPNGCIEDEYGYLYIEKVRFKKKNND
jgi:hypothetical protein